MTARLSAVAEMAEGMRALLAAIGARGGWSAYWPVDTVSKARVALEALTTLSTNERFRVVAGAIVVAS